MKHFPPTALSRTLAHPLVVGLARLVLCGTLLVAGLLKLADLPQTLQAVTAYQLLPEIFLWPAALLLPWAEIVAALGFLWKPTRPVAQLWIGALLGIFLLALLAAWGRGLDIDCGCFGGSGIANYPWLILRDLGLFFLLWISRVPLRATRKISA